MANKKILVIDDDYLDVTSVKRALSKLKADFTLYVAHNGEEALSMLMGNYDRAQKVQPDIILLDINMPRMNGIEFLTIIKKYYSLNNIKVYIMTTSAEERDKAEAEKLGICGYILKPLDFAYNRRDGNGAAIADLKRSLCGQ